MTIWAVGGGTNYGYPVGVLGDGEATSINIDLGLAIQADPTIANKTPQGVCSPVSDSEGNSVALTVIGTVVTATWDPALPLGQQTLISVPFYFIP